MLKPSRRTKDLISSTLVVAGFFFVSFSSGAQNFVSRPLVKLKQKIMSGLFDPNCHVIGMEDFLFNSALSSETLISRRHDWLITHDLNYFKFMLSLTHRNLFTNVSKMSLTPEERERYAAQAESGQQFRARFFSDLWIDLRTRDPDIRLAYNSVASIFTPQSDRNDVDQDAPITNERATQLAGQEVQLGDNSKLNLTRSINRLENFFEEPKSSDARAVVWPSLGVISSQLARAYEALQSAETRVNDDLQTVKSDSVGPASTLYRLQFSKESLGKLRDLVDHFRHQVNFIFRGEANESSEDIDAVMQFFRKKFRFLNGESIGSALESRIRFSREVSQPEFANFVRDIAWDGVALDPLYWRKLDQSRRSIVFSRSVESTYPFRGVYLSLAMAAKVGVAYAAGIWALGKIAEIPRLIPKHVQILNPSLDSPSNGNPAAELLFHTYGSDDRLIDKIPFITSLDRRETLKSREYSFSYSIPEKTDETARKLFPPGELAPENYNFRVVADRSIKGEEFSIPTPLHCLLVGTSEPILGATYRGGSTLIRPQNGSIRRGFTAYFQFEPSLLSRDADRELLILDRNQLYSAITELNEAHLFKIASELTRLLNDQPFVTARDVAVVISKFSFYKMVASENHEPLIKKNRFSRVFFENTVDGVLYCKCDFAQRLLSMILSQFQFRGGIEFREAGELVTANGELKTPGHVQELFFDHGTLFRVLDATPKTPAPESPQTNWQLVKNYLSRLFGRDHAIGDPDHSTIIADRLEPGQKKKLRTVDSTSEIHDAEPGRFTIDADRWRDYVKAHFVQTNGNLDPPIDREAELKKQLDQLNTSKEGASEQWRTNWNFTFLKIAEKLGALYKKAGVRFSDNYPHVAVAELLAALSGITAVNNRFEIRKIESLLGKKIATLAELTKSIEDFMKAQENIFAIAQERCNGDRDFRSRFGRFFTMEFRKALFDELSATIRRFTSELDARVTELTFSEAGVPRQDQRQKISCAGAM